MQIDDHYFISYSYFFSEYFMHYDQDIACSSNGTRRFPHRLVTLKLSVGIFHNQWQQVSNLESDSDSCIML